MNYKDSRYADWAPGVAAVLLAAEDYRQTSRRFGHVAKVDLTDKELLEFALAEDLIRIENLKDHYRRCHSKDRIEEVPEEVMSLLREYSDRFGGNK